MNIIVFDIIKKSATARLITNMLDVERIDLALKFKAKSTTFVTQNLYDTSRKLRDGSFQFLKDLPNKAEDEQLSVDLYFSMNIY
jgi:hypothetical protein